MPEAPAVITCVDCGEDSHLLAVRGDVATYRCSGCADRWDVVIDDLDDEPAAGPHPPPPEGEPGSG